MKRNKYFSAHFALNKKIIISFKKNNFFNAFKINNLFSRKIFLGLWVPNFNITYETMKAVKTC